MASSEQVKQYLALWFQLGKTVILGNGSIRLCPRTIAEGDRYSKEFEESWQRILASANSAYLEGTPQTIAELLTSAWEMGHCARCAMDVPLPVGNASSACPCNDLPSWPDQELPHPRPPISTQAHLHRVLSNLQSSRGVGSDSRT